MSNEPRAQAGISAFDVRDYARSIARHFNCDLHYLVSLPLREGTKHALDFRVTARGTSMEPGGRAWERGASRPWPTGECRTITGLMFRLLHDLEVKLEEREAEAKRLTQGSLFDNQ